MAKEYSPIWMTHMKVHAVKVYSKIMGTAAYTNVAILWDR